MQPFQQRVIDERLELNNRRNKLIAFIETLAFQQLPPADRRRLQQQEYVMGLYSEILGERISAFSD